ncbi:beta-class carbonic anhydrase [Kyrpidia tusciae]|uniref:carbonic anhydrase n=1 Tax=Kyrpidia tusciae (strain DSM 2912 / NBRC 15312 / T2) TaxID=562970 RepID=D5WVK6_KYRT2|nr:carbonic anhydrase [Kyrpidia tusciae]ADG07549.1 carbonic anhydrase [Kyrpidia tusciae DSM 2912]
MSEVKKLFEANRTYASQFSQGQLPIPPARKVAVLTCMDARIDPLRALGADLGDIHVIRNAGGRVTEDAIRSLVISEQLLGTQEILVLHHTDCGMLTFRNEDLYDKISRRLGPDSAKAASNIDFLPFTDLEQSVRDDVETLRNSPLIPSDVLVYGAVYDVHTGEVIPVS